MTDLAAIARDNAVHCEAKKHAYRQTQDGVVVSFVLHPQEVPNGLAVASLGTRYILALAEIGDDEKPKEVMPTEGTSATRKPETPPRAEADNAPRGARRSWHDMSPAQQAGILANDAKFQRYVAEIRYGTATKRAMNEEDAAEFIRRSCSVNSRADIKPDSDEAKKWGRLVNSFRAWEQAPMVGAD